MLQTILNTEEFPLGLDILWSSCYPKAKIILGSRCNSAWFWPDLQGKGLFFIYLFVPSLFLFCSMEIDNLPQSKGKLDHNLKG